MQVIDNDFTIDQYNPINFKYYAYFKKAQKESKGNQAMFNALMQNYREEFLKGQNERTKNKEIQI